MLSAGEFDVNMSIDHDARVLRPFRVHVDVPAEAGVGEVSAVFVMRGMKMGLNRYHFVDQGNNRWRADVTLPVCVSGRSDWIAELELLTRGQRIQLNVAFAIAR